DAEPLEVILVEILRRCEDELAPFTLFRNRTREVEVQRHVLELLDVRLVDHEYIALAARADEPLLAIHLLRFEFVARGREKHVACQRLVAGQILAIEDRLFAQLLAEPEIRKCPTQPGAQILVLCLWHALDHAPYALGGDALANVLLVLL